MGELDRLLAAAREAEPAPLSPAETLALVERARRGAATPVERMLEEARRAEPDPLSERELRSMVQHAAMTGRARHRRWTRRRVMAASAMAATLAAAAVTLFVLERGPIDPALATTAPPEAAEPTDLDLPTGDRLVAASGARFQVELPEPRARRVELGGGSMLFDVRPLEGGRFSVTTPNARVEVLGTVFSVRATERATTVWVYEGAVRVRSPSGARVLSAGGVLHLGEGEAGEDALAEAGREAAERREARRAEVAAAVIEERPTAQAEPEARVVPAVVDTPSAPPSREPRPRVAREAAPDEAAAVPPASATPAEVRALIAHGDRARALEAAREAIARGETDPWRMLEGDALRALGRFEDAAAAYRRAAAELSPPRRQQAGFLEARVRMAQLDDPDGALRALRDADVTRAGSVLRERGMALEVRLLAQLGRRAEAASVARDYLRDYPDGPDAEAMRARASSREAPED